jgi:hypothetical protein
MSEKTEALRLAAALGNLEATGHCSDSVSLTDRSEAIADAAAAELRRLSIENEALRKAYWKMRNSAAAYGNYCDDNANTRRCERDYIEGEALYRAAIKAVEEA